MTSFFALGKDFSQLLSTAFIRWPGSSFLRPNLIVSTSGNSGMGVIIGQMTDSLKNILGKREYQQPDEIAYIKNFVQEKFGEQPKVRITSRSIIINVSNSSLAGALRVHLYKIERDLKLKKPLRIVIG